MILFKHHCIKNGNFHKYPCFVYYRPFQYTSA
nr:MAG TPA: hypothetical protein [Caudoviricetes sp.]